MTTLPMLRVATVAALRRAGQRAGTVGAPDVAERLYAQAGELSNDERERAELDEAAGEMASGQGGPTRRSRLLERAGSRCIRAPAASARA